MFRSFFFASRRRHTRCALVTEFRRVLFRSLAAGHHQRRLAFQHHAVPDRADGIEDDPLLGGLDLLHGDPRLDGVADLHRRLEASSEERRVGKECVSTGRFRWSPYTSKKKKYPINKTPLTSRRTNNDNS